ncbi:MAG TPA: cation:proton antiporter family protein [Myxococcaceae bacterium]|nr:cation:proton antiporter family protein [Myxococcaceae bacterium]
MPELLAESLFYEVAALLVLASGVGMLGLALRQPLIVSFIAVGILTGPAVLGITAAGAHIELFAELGVALLLFLVGLKLDLHLVRTLGKVALVTGLGQVLFTSVFGLLLCLLLGLDVLTSIYVAVALTFSSTIIIVKLLSDKREIDSLHGRIALGFLIVQDLVVVLAMVVLSALGVEQKADAPVQALLRLGLGGLGIGLMLGLFMRHAAEPLLRRLSHSPELLVTFAVGWASVLAAGGELVGFGKELGGLVAGVSLASTSFRDAIATRLTSLRDFLLLFFFVVLGARLELELLGESPWAALVLSLFVLIGNPLVVLAILGVMGYRKRTGFLAGLTVAQISEFSLIFIAMGQSLGHVDSRAVALVTLVGLVTIAVSTYMIIYSLPLYALLAPLLQPFERAVPYRELAQQEEEQAPYDCVLFGLGRYGAALYLRLLASGQRVLGVDFDPEAVKRWQARGHAAIYGDAMDPSFVTHLPLKGVRWVVSTVRHARIGLTHEDSRLALIQALREHGYEERIAVTANLPGQVPRLLREGADLVLLPFEDAADQAVDLLLGRQRRQPHPDLSHELEHTRD